jgi:hypothetical protein
MVSAFFTSVQLLVEWYLVKTYYGMHKLMCYIQTVESSHSHRLDLLLEQLW